MGYRLVHLAALSIAGRTHDNRSHAASEGRGRGSDLAVTAGELNAGAGVGRLGTVRAWGVVMRVLLPVLLVGIAGCGEGSSAPGDVAAPSSPTISQAKSEKKAAAQESVEGWETLTLKGHTDSVSSVSFSPDGKRIVSGSGDKTVKVCDLSSLPSSK